MRETYLENGQPVTVLARRQSTARGLATGSEIWHRPPKRHAPFNLLIRRPGGQLVVRPFRGLRKPKDSTDA